MIKFALMIVLWSALIFIITPQDDQFISPYGSYMEPQWLHFNVEPEFSCFYIGEMYQCRVYERTVV